MTPEQAAQQLGMSYLPAGDKAFRDAWTVLPEVSKSGKIKHIIFGELDGVEATCFQHQMTVHTGQAPIVVSKSIYSCETSIVPVTQIFWRDFFQRVFLKFGIRRGIGTGDDAFDRAWRIKAEDPAFATSLMNERLRAHIKSKQRVYWRLQNGRLCLIYNGKMRADRVGASFERLMIFRRLAGPALGLTGTTDDLA